jgi:membrane protein involved in colicin uptake
MSDLRDDPTPWHQAADVVAERDAMREALRRVQERVRQEHDARRHNADALWKANDRANAAEAEVRRLRAAIDAHRGGILDSAWTPKRPDLDLWAVLDA